MIIIPSNVLGSPSDPFFSNTVLLLKTVNVGGASNSAFFDDGPNRFVPTRVGDVTQGSLSPYVPTGYWSGYFDGNGDHLTLPSSSAFTLGTSDWTVECWLKKDSVGTRNIWVFGSAGASDAVLFADGVNNLTYYVGSTRINAGTLNVGRWHHVAVVRSSGLTRIYLDGVQQGSAWADSTNYTATTVTIGWSGSPVDGHISNFRIVKSAVYTANFTPPSEPLTAISGTSLLTLQDNRFIDRSSNNFALTRNGDVSVQRFSPFPISNTVTTNLAATGSVTFDGNGDYMTVPHSSVFNMGTGAFTAEFWMSPTAAPTGFAVTMISSYNGSNDGWEIQWRASPQAIRFGLGDSALMDRDFPASTYVGKWTHIAVAREANGTTRMFFDGVQQGATANLGSTSLNSGSSTFNVGLLSVATGQHYNGLLSNVRVVKGSALYTANFTPPTTPLTAITGTSLLTAQDAVTVTDASTNNFTITRVGDAKASEVSPFKRSTAQYGGSAYFDGVGDHLTFAPNNQFAFGTADFTVECMVLNTGVSNTNGIFQISPDTYFNSTAGIAAHAFAGGAWYMYTGAGLAASASGQWITNVWYHVAVVRASGVTRLYVNGVALITIADTTNYTGNYLGIGGVFSTDDSNKHRGYISNFRVVKGTAVYTAAFTPPTAPVTAITGTTLLLNFDNAGIHDATAANALNTRGDAKTSTAVTLFGGSTMYFDGNGDYLTIPASNRMAFGTGDFTVECHINISATGGNDGVIAEMRNTGGTSTGFVFNTRPVAGGFVLNCYIDGAANIGSVTLPYNSWHHVALCRSGTTMRLFGNGTVHATFTKSNNLTDTPVVTIGQSLLYADSNITGYLSNLRMTRTARYTANFTPPTAELPAR